ncbi:OmpA family protein [Labilibaculum sp.]|uniref:OmpA family protein n=1 Tax=Labilibaculum sp. TaxID=2060723 RepID=UPI0035659ADE
MVLKLKFLVFFMLVNTLLYSQTKEEKKGNKAFLKRDYPEAVRYLESVNEKNTELYRKIAESYFMMGNYQQSADFFNQISEDEKVPTDLFHLSQIDLANDNFAAAVLYAEQAGEMGANPNDLQIQLDAIHEVIALRKINKDLKISKLEAQPRGKCLGISMLPEGIVYSEQSRGKQKKGESYRLFLADSQASDFVSPKLYASELEIKTDLGAVCLSPDGNTLYYTRWYLRKGKQQMEIAIAKRRKGEWQAKESLGFCSRKYSCCYPYLSPDGDRMYFSSDMEGGYGGMDLYVSERNGDRWTQPVNLGSAINSAKNEIYPRMLANNYLWFSSDGRSGYGNFDLFYTKKNEDGSWSPVINPGAPYNSAYSDYSLVNTSDPEVSLFVSDREDQGLRDQIFKLESQKMLRIDILVKDEQNNEFLEDLKVSVRNVNLNKKISLSEEEVSKGKITFEIPSSEAEKRIEYQIAIQKKGYQNQLIDYYSSNPKREIEVSLVKNSEQEAFSFVSELLPMDDPKKKITFKNIYFQREEKDFSPQAKNTLDRLVRFWKAFPDLGIKINVHTDAEGAVQENWNLSLRKAQETKNYLVKKGVNASQIETLAWGEEFILNASANQSEASEILQQKNRRIELIFVL